MANRLAHETSPYLRQHADNPVDWFPWGDEAFAEAKRRDVPIFLSVGYSACHWCHVMAHTFTRIWRFTGKFGPSPAGSTALFGPVLPTVFPRGKRHDDAVVTVAHQRAAWYVRDVEGFSCP
ncbi:MAG: DUF255 domain-containing protein [Nitriliruptor sp.]